VANDVRQDVAHQLGGRVQRVVPGGEGLAHLSLIPPFVEARILEGDGERGERSAELPLRDGTQDRRIEPAGQVSRDRDVGAEPQAHRVLQDLADPLHCPPLVDRLDAGVVEVEVPPARDVELPVGEPGEAACRQRADALQTRSRRYRGPELHRLLHAPAVEPPIDESARHQRLRLRCEGEAVRGERVVEGEDTHAVARQVQLARPWIEERESELPVQAVEAFDAPPEEGRQQDLGVRARPEWMTGELLPQLDVVEDLAVEDEGHTRGRIPHRLGTALDVQDGKPGVTHGGTVQEQTSLRIRPSVPQARRHPAKPRAEALTSLPGREPPRRREARDPAHGFQAAKRARSA
jgi:hypothetical protein